MKKKKIAIIGMGNMGSAIATGLINSKTISPKDIYVSMRKGVAQKKVTELGLKVVESNIVAVEKTDVVIVAVKPYHVENVLKEISPLLTENKILISIVAGVGLEVLGAMIGKKTPVFRVMPNTAVAIQESLTCISSNGNCENYKEYVFELFNSLGKTVEIEEDLMAAATVLASCGIAYALRYIRAAMQGGIEIGFNADVAQLITAQTVKGAAELILQSNNHPEREIDKVTTPMGITITGLNEMENKGFSASLIQGILSSFKKIKQL